MASMSAFQAEDAGSIPVSRSIRPNFIMKLNQDLLELIIF